MVRVSSRAESYWICKDCNGYSSDPPEYDSDYYSERIDKYEELLKTLRKCLIKAEKEKWECQLKTYEEEKKMLKSEFDKEHEKLVHKCSELQEIISDMLLDDRIHKKPKLKK